MIESLECIESACLPPFRSALARLLADSIPERLLFLPESSAQTNEERRKLRIKRASSDGPGIASSRFHDDDRINCSRLLKEALSNDQ